MKEPVDYSLEDLIETSEALLEDLGDLSSLGEETEQIDKDKIQEEIRNRFADSSDEQVVFSNDGYVEITVTEDEMTAKGDFYPPTAGRQPVDADTVSKVLDMQEIRYGVDWETINEAMFRCNTEHNEVTEVIVARGTQPVHEQPEHLLIAERLLSKEQGLDSDSLRVDYREATPFVLVKKNEVLARLIPKRGGTEGRTVRGRTLPHLTVKVSKLTAGKNTRLEGDRVLAELDGRFQRGRDSFWVNEVLEIDGDVDYRTGHIDFPGDVVIKGEIKAGFRVHSGGSVYCSKTMDASEVTSRGDLIVAYGLLGRKKGKVRVGGDVRVKFIENCYVEAGGSISVGVGILNSAVYSLNKVELGKKGIIVGGSVYAQNGVSASQLGTGMGPRTEIYCGLDYSVEQKLEWIRDKNLELAFKLKQVQNKLRSSAVGSERLLEVEEKVKSTIHKLNQAAQQLVFRLDRNEAAEVVVSGRVYAGVYVEICHVSYIVTRTLQGIKFSLDKAKGKIMTKPLLARKAS
jgi:uncharacterized protein (DUF342 family)